MSAVSNHQRGFNVECNRHAYRSVQEYRARLQRNLVMFKARSTTPTCSFLDTYRARLHRGKKVPAGIRYAMLCEVCAVSS